MNYLSLEWRFAGGVRRTLAALAAVLCLSAAGGALAVDLKMERRSGADGKPQVCVSLAAQGSVVAGTQNDLVWEPGCANLASEKQCVASPHHKKPLHGSIPKNQTATFRSLVFALDNVDPMPDGELYCCTFDLAGSSDTCCPVQMARVAVSDPDGNSLDTQAVPDKVCLLGDAPPAAAAAQPAAPAAAAPAEEPSGPTWIWVAVFAAVVLVVLFLALRRAS